MSPRATSGARAGRARRLMRRASTARATPASSSTRAIPTEGLLFDGRIAEDFKLITGTWVTAGPLRLRLLSEAKVLSDAVICGHDREFVAAMAWVNQTEARGLSGARARYRARRIPRLREHLAPGADADSTRAPAPPRGSSGCSLLTEPPDLDAGEITDKGYINQRACLARRSDEVEPALRRGARPRGDRCGLRTRSSRCERRGPRRSFAGRGHRRPQQPRPRRARSRHGRSRNAASRGRSTSSCSGLTIPQKESFYGAPTLAARLGFAGVSGPMIAQACAHVGRGDPRGGSLSGGIVRWQRGWS